jgi:hypothetical protein
MEKQVHEITGIAVQALRGDPLSDFSVTDRLSWAAKRETTREEDKAYCLLGIFDIYMPLIYGEGKKAFNRLHEEINKCSKGQLLAFSLALFRKKPFQPSSVGNANSFCLQRAKQRIYPFHRPPSLSDAIRISSIVEQYWARSSRSV